MKNKLSKVALLSIITASFSTTSVLAESMTEQIKRRAAEIADLKGMLNNPDQSIRLAALDTMLKSKDTAMRELAYSVGLNSADDAVRAITLRNKFNELSTLSINVSLPENAIKEQKSFFNKYAGGGVYLITFENYDETKGSFKFKDQSNSTGRNGSISGLTMSYKGYYCNGSLVLNEESEFQGVINCKGQSFPAKAVIL